MRNEPSFLPSQFVTCMILFLLCAFAHAEPATESSTREYLKLSGTEAASVEVMNKLISGIRERTQDIPEDLWRELTRTDKFMEETVPVFRKYFTEAEMQDLIAFYKTPTGVKLASVFNKINNELFERGAQEARMTTINYYIQKGNFSMVKSINDNNPSSRSNIPLQRDATPAPRP